MKCELEIVRFIASDIVTASPGACGDTDNLIPGGCNTVFDNI